MQEKSYLIDNKKLMEEWDYELNNSLNPIELLTGSNKKVWWKCNKCGHKWQAYIIARAKKNSGCPACAGRVPIVGVNDIFTVKPELKEEWDYTKNININPFELPKGSHVQVWWVCKKCRHSWKASIRRRTEGSGCPCCANRITVSGINDLATTHPEIAKEWHLIKNEKYTPSQVTAGSNKLFWWKCSVCGYEWKASPNSRASRGSGCIQCHKHKIKNKESCFEITHPELARDWDYSKNGVYKPSQFRKGSGFLAWWKCSVCGYEVQRTIHDYKGCSLCMKLNKMKKEDILINSTKLMEEWDYELNFGLNPAILSRKSSKKAWWKCSNCGNKWQASIYKRAIDGRGCSKCQYHAREKYYFQTSLDKTNPELVVDWHPTKNGKLRPHMFTRNSKYKIWWKCHTCGKEVEKTINNYHGCNECKKQLVLNERNLSITHPHLLNEWNYEKNKTITPQSVLASDSKKVWWKCAKCNHEWQAKINNRTILNRGCPCCANKVIVVGKNDLATTHPEIAKEWHPTKNGELTPQKVVHGTGKKVWWLCPLGHEYRATVLHRTQENGTNCPICNSGRQTSFVEQIVYYYVKKLYPDAINRYKSDFLERMELDIFIPSIKCAIEYDGSHWHRKEKSNREERKYKKCQEQNIKLIRLKEQLYKTDSAIADYIIDIPDKHTDKNFEKAIKLLLNYINFKNAKVIDVNIKRDKQEILKYKIELVKDSLLHKFPEIAKEWHPTKNSEFKPNMFKSGSDYKAWWLCPVCGHEYKTSISHRTAKKPTNCPLCSAKKRGQHSARKVNMIDIETNQIIKTFNSLSEAGRELGINGSNIGMVCRNSKRTAGGHKWSYA